jgi:hypothetical protein
VCFGQKQLLALRIEFHGARKRELASVRKDTVSKNGLALFAFLVASQFANVQHQDARTLTCARERGKYR